MSYKTHSRNKHEEILQYFSEIDMWDGIGTLKEILFCFFHEGVIFFFPVLLNACIGTLISMPVA